ncbi:MAG TPA: response regulator transcription factor, partial [Chloroflexota bacterium]|nr:response regulator transcription factor [Chloroflexota bacterium]
MHSHKVMGSMIRLFVASDYPVVRAGFRSILDASGEFQVVGEGALDEAAGQAAALAVEVMLLDVSGSDRDEMEALWRLSSDAPGLAIVLLSSDPGEGAAREALQAGARAYLLRDASSEEIRAAVLAAHRGLTVLH